MSESLVDTFTSQTKMFSEPMGKVSSLMVANIEKLAEFQLDTVKSYAELAMEQWQKVAEVKDLESFKAFGTSQSELATEMGKKVSDDFKALGEMGMEFKAEMEEIFQEARNPTETSEEATAAPATEENAKSVKS